MNVRLCTSLSCANSLGGLIVSSRWQQPVCGEAGSQWSGQLTTSIPLLARELLSGWVPNGGVRTHPLYTWIPRYLLVRDGIGSVRWTLQ